MNLTNLQLAAYREQQEFLFRLMFDEELRHRFVHDRAATLDEERLSDESRHMFEAVDGFGLVVDAELRRDYLMSALCRPYPLAAAALGSLVDGPRRLAAFLSSPAVHGELADRTHAFGDHLRRLITLSSDVPREARPLLEAVLDFELALVENAAAIRAAYDKGERIPSPEKPRSSDKKRLPVALPAFFLVAELPVPTGVLETALDHVSAADCWQKIKGHELSFERVLSVARALPMPVTRIARGVVRGHVAERAGAGGAAPLVEVSHLSAELNGKMSAVFAAIDGDKTLNQLPHEARKLCETLVDQGLLILQGGCAPSPARE